MLYLQTMVIFYYFLVVIVLNYFIQTFYRAIPFIIRLIIVIIITIKELLLQFFAY